MRVRLRNPDRVEEIPRRRRVNEVRADPAVDPGAYGYDIPSADRKRWRSTCSVCGFSKRCVFTRVALDLDFDVVTTGHNLDDEAVTLLGNTLRWQTEYIARQYPALTAREGMVEKITPLHRLSEQESAAYAFLSEIDYVIKERPQ